MNPRAFLDGYRSKQAAYAPYNAAAANTRFDTVARMVASPTSRQQMASQMGMDLSKAAPYKPPTAAPSAAPAPIAVPKPQQPANPLYTHTQDYQRALNRTGSTMQMVGDRMVVRGPKREAAMQPKAVGTAPVANAVNPATAFWPQAQQRLSTAMAQPGAASSTASAPPAAAAGTAPLATAVNPATALWPQAQQRLNATIGAPAPASATAPPATVAAPAGARKPAPGTPPSPGPSAGIWGYLKGYFNESQNYGRNPQLMEYYARRQARPRT